MARAVRKCGFCGREFVPNNPTQKYCSKACSTEVARIQARRNAKKYRVLGYSRQQKRVCPHCGKIFVSDRTHIKYCSLTCQKAFAAQKKFDAYWRERGKPKKCAFCGCSFKPTTLKQKYCSPRCRSLAHDNGGRIRTVKCQMCGREFEADYEAKFCSAKCRNNAAANKLAAEAMLKAEGKPTKSLAEWCREAAECNLDYGTYRGLIESGRSYDELKTIYAENVPACHNHTPKKAKSGSYGVKIC